MFVKQWSDVVVGSQLLQAAVDRPLSLVVLRRCDGATLPSAERAHAHARPQQHGRHSAQHVGVAGVANSLAHTNEPTRHIRLSLSPSLNQWFVGSTMPPHAPDRAAADNDELDAARERARCDHALYEQVARLACADLLARLTWPAQTDAASFLAQCRAGNDSSAAPADDAIDRAIAHLFDVEARTQALVRRALRFNALRHGMLSGGIDATRLSARAAQLLLRRRPPADDADDAEPVVVAPAAARVASVCLEQLSAEAIADALALNATSELPPQARVLAARNLVGRPTRRLCRTL